MYLINEETEKMSASVHIGGETSSSFFLVSAEVGLITLLLCSVCKKLVKLPRLIEEESVEDNSH
jgi:hypothetical protein